MIFLQRLIHIYQTQTYLLILLLGNLVAACLMIDEAISVLPHPAGAMMSPLLASMAHSTARCWYGRSRNACVEMVSG